MLKTSKINYVFVYVILIMISLVVLFPVYWLVSMSLKTPMDINAPIPKYVFTPTLMNYSIILGFRSLESSITGGVLGADFFPYYRNSIIIVVGSVFLAFVLGIPVAYVLARMKFRGKKNFTFFYISIYFMPAIVVLIPLYLTYQKLHLYNTYMGIILVMQLVNLPLVILFMRRYFEEIPREVEESALLDGCSWFHVLTRITIPLSRPAIVTTALLCIIFSWQNFIFGLILGGRSTQPVTVGILNFMSYEKVAWGLLGAASVLTMLPLLVIGVVIQKHIVEGLTLGALH